MEKGKAKRKSQSSLIVQNASSPAAESVPTTLCRSSSRPPASSENPQAQPLQLD